MEESWYERGVRKALNDNKNAIQDWATNQGTPLSRICVPGLSRHQTKSLRQCDPLHFHCKALHLQNIPYERKVVLRLSRPVPILTRPKPHYSIATTQNIHENLLLTEEKVEQISIACLFLIGVFKPRTHHHVIITTNSSGLIKTEIRVGSTSCEWSFLARGITDISIKQVMYITVIIFCDR